MGCINNIKLPFSATVNVPKGFYYNDENQLSFAVSTDDLNLYVVEEFFMTNELINPCTQENIQDVKVTVKEVRMGGTLAYRVALNALISSYNFMLGTQSNVNDDGWSSADGYIPMEIIEGLEKKEYVVVGYLDPANPIIPTKEDVIVILESFNVIEHDLTEGKILEITGEVSFTMTA